jgi:P27 family predicted phage terminase small subunit
LEKREWGLTDVAPRGRKPKPIELRILQGNPGQRRIPSNVPRPAPVAPSCPDHLDAVAKAEWRRIAKPLEQLGLLTVLDRAALAGYCQLYSRWVACEAAIEEHGMTYETERLDQEGRSLGTVVRTRPEVTIARQSLQLIRAFCSEFGCTASSRARLVVPGADNDDPQGVLS